MLRLVAPILALLALGGAGLSADPPEVLKVLPRRLDSVKSKGEGMDVIGGNSREAVKNIVLSAEEYKKLLDTIEQFKKMAAPEKPEVPTKCRLTAQVMATGRQELVKVQITFDFVTVGAKTTVALGCRNAAAVSAVLDESKLPVLLSSADGYSVLVDASGPHRLTLGLEVPLSSRGVNGAERGFALSLPGSPITLIERIDFPAGIASVRLRRSVAAATPPTLIQPPQTFAVAAFAPARDGPPTMALGPVENVELSWDGPARQNPIEPLLVATGEIVVQFVESGATTTARLTLRSMIGRLAEWKIQAPAEAEVAVDPAVASDWEVIQTGDKTTWRLRSKAAPAESLRVDVVIRSPGNGNPVPIGPVVVAGAFRHQGTIRIRSPNALRPRIAKLRSDVVRSEADSDGELAFQYGGSGAADGVAPWLLLDAEPMRGEIRTQVTHQLALSASGWRLMADIRATPIRTELDHLDVDVPTAMQELLATPPELVESIVPRRDLGPNRWQIRLAQARKSETVVKLEGFYPSAESTRETVLALPRVVQTFDRDARVQATVPDGIELHATVSEWERDRISPVGKLLESVPGSAGKLAVTCAQSAGSVNLSWGLVHSELTVDSIVDLTLNEKTAVARHRLRFQPSAAARRIGLRSVGPPVGALHVVEGGRMIDRDGQKTLALAPSPVKEQIVILNYVIPLALHDESENRRRVEVGMLWPDGATECTTRLRIWSGATIVNYRPTLTQGLWELLPVEAVPDFPSLPALVLSGLGAGLPLELSLTETSGVVSSGLSIERALILASVSETGRQDYSARFVFHRGAAAMLEFELPATPAEIDLRILLGSKRLDQFAVLDEAGAAQTAGSGRSVRIPLQGISAETIELTFEYRLVAPPRSGRGGPGWSWSFAPPKVRGPASIRDVRWYVEFPSDGVFLNWDIATALDQRWTRRKLLPALHPALTIAELETWFATGSHSEQMPDHFWSEMTGPENVAVARTADLAPIRLTQAPRTGWVLACSLAVLAIGMLLNSWRRVSVLFWCGLALLPLTLGTAALFYPQPVAAALAASPPGLFVLGLVLAVHWLLRHRYRRRVVFMPGFTRMTAPGVALPGLGSSLRRRQASTIDAPPT